jgi:hypothetical protein
MRSVVLPAVLLASALAGAPASAVPPDAPHTDDLYRGWLQMYDLKFDQSHQTFQAWKQTHPSDSLGPASDAAAYLFSELARLGVLESELFTDNDHFLSRDKVRPDPGVKSQFDREIAATERLANSSLQTNSSDANALFAKSLSFGLRADCESLLERHDLAALKFTKEGRTYGEKLMSVDPKDYDGYLGPGIENYLLSLKPAPVRAFLWLTGSLVDRAKGVDELRMTAQYGHYLEPFAKLLLAVAALRDNNRVRAREILGELHTRFPDNQLYLRELNRLNPPAK